jgi:RND family efflux transporter MFP subunit
MVRTLTLTATLEPYEQVPLYAKVAGYVSSLGVDIGDRVHKGQVLATLEVPEIQDQHVQAQNALRQHNAELLRAQAEEELRKAIFSRSEGLRKKDAITQQDMEEARAHYKTAQADVELAKSARGGAEARVAELETLMAYARLTSPFDGVVTRRFVDRGALVQAATANNNITPIVTVARIDILRAFIDVPEPDAEFVARGESAVLQVAALSSAQRRGEVTRLAEALDPATRTMRTEVDLDNSSGELRPGMYGSLTISLENHPRALTIPNAALHREGGASFVYVLEAGRIHRRHVETALASDERVEIVAGVSEGESTIVRGSGLKEGARARVFGEAGRTLAGGAR